MDLEPAATPEAEDWNIPGFGQAVGGFDSYVAGMIGSVPSSQFISHGSLTSQEQEKMKKGLELGIGLEARRL
jgi:hypothetical protein